MRNYLMLLGFLCITQVAWGTDYSFPLNDSAQIDTKEDTLLKCLDVPLDLSSTAADGYAWSPAVEISDTTQKDVTIFATESRWYYLTATVGNGECVDSIYISVIDPSFELIVSTMDTICPEERVDVTFDASSPISSITWEPEDGVVRPDDVNGSAIRPLRTTEYIVTATIGNCELSDTFTIEVIPFELTNQTPDTVFLCKPDSAILRILVEPAGTNIEWSPLDGTIDPMANGTRAEVYPEVTTLYTATASSMGCTLERQTLVRVDSLPELRPLTPIPFKDPFCAGDTFWIIGPAVDTALYPDLEWRWDPQDGQIEGPEPAGRTGNVRIRIQDTTLFIRTATNNACEDTSSLLINAIPPEIPLSLNDTMACPGEQFVVEVLDPNIMDLEWEPTTGLSCSDCPDPTVTVQEQEIQYMITGNKEDCPVSASLTVSPLPSFLIPVIPGSAFGCEGDEIQLTIDTFLLSNLTISIGGGDGSVSCTDCPDPIVTVGTQNGVINITADVPDSLGCGAFAQVPYGVGSPEMAIIEQSICPDEPTELDLADLGFTQGEIIDIDEGGIASCDGLNCTVTIGQNGGSMFVESTDAAPGFCNKVTEIIFSPSPNDTASFDEAICREEPTEINLGNYGLSEDDIQSIDEGGIASCDGINCTVTIGPGGGQLSVISSSTDPDFCNTETIINFIALPNDGGMIVALDSMGFGQGQSITFQLEPPGPAGSTYEWYVNGELQDDMANPATVVMPTMGDMAEVTVIWTNSQGCLEMASESYELEEPDIEFPNAFTPNGDDTNERFRPRVVGPAQLDELLVFNRWGQVVYEGDDPEGWDGRFKGEPAPTEVYVYLATFRFPNGDKIEYKGDVTLIR